MKQLVFFGATILTLLTACSGLTDNHLPSEEIEEIKSGHYSNYPGEGQVERVITSKSIFEAEWEKVYTSTSPLPEVPTIDFENRTIILIMLDQKPSGGYAIDELNISYNQSEIVVGYSEVEPGPNCVTTDAITRPFVFISIPKLDGEINIIKENIITTDCSE